MQDGMVVFTTPNISDVVGFSMDMWLGRSLIDFVHPKDRAAFTSHITSGIVTPLTHTNTKGMYYRNGWIILGWISRRWDVGMWTGLGWPRIGIGGGRL